MTWLTFVIIAFILIMLNKGRNNIDTSRYRNVSCFSCGKSYWIEKEYYRGICPHCNYTNSYGEL